MPILTQAILPVAGLGTRFFPWTKVVPKELLPIGNRPIIAYLVDECLEIGIKDICLVISHGKEAIPEFFYEDHELANELEIRGKGNLISELKKYNEMNFHVVYQNEQKGDGHAICQATDWVKSDAVAILFGDDLIAHEKSGMKQLADAYATVPAGGAMLCLENIPRDCTEKYGIAAVEQTDGRLKRVTGLVEKPKPADAPSTLGIVGKYIIPKSTFGVLPTVAGSHGGEIRLIDALIEQLKGGMPVHGYEVEGIRLDTGTPEGYKKAVQMLG